MVKGGRILSARKYRRGGRRQNINYKGHRLSGCAIQIDFRREGEDVNDAATLNKKTHGRVGIDGLGC